MLQLEKAGRELLAGLSHEAPPLPGPPHPSPARRWHREHEWLNLYHEWLNLYEAACGPPAAAA